MQLQLDEQQVAQYQRDGYLLVPDVLNREEITLLTDAIEGNGRVHTEGSETVDGTGKRVRLAIWNELTDDIWSAVTTLPGIVKRVRILLGEEIAFYHGKVMLKEPKTGGAWEWHQDYGYWYNNGFVFPRMISAFVALDAATKENGCLEVLESSHLLGRLEHCKIGKQTAVDPDRISLLEPLFEHVYCEMKPGSVLYFHCNLLHTSKANTSDKSRRSFIICFNALSNPRITTGVGRFDASKEACPTGPEDGILRFKQ